MLGIAFQWKFTRLWLDAYREWDQGLRLCFMDDVRKKMTRLHVLNYLCERHIKLCNESRRLYVECEHTRCYKPGDVRLFTCIIVQDAVQSQRGPRDAAINFDMYRILQQHRAVSLSQHGFLVGLCLQTAVNYPIICQKVTSKLTRKKQLDRIFNADK